MESDGANECLFCTFRVDTENTLLANNLFFARFDNYPVSEGHTLIIPQRHVETPFELTSEELVALGQILERVRAYLAREFSADGYNIGINVGQAAGQTIMHLHIHVIPRHEGDVEDPKGGVRNLIPNLVDYP